MSKPPWVGKGTVKKDNSSSSSTGGGGEYNLKTDPTLPPTSKAIVDKSGKRVGTVKQKGGKWYCSCDSFTKAFASSSAALSFFASSKG